MTDMITVGKYEIHHVEHADGKFYILYQPGEGWVPGIFDSPETGIAAVEILGKEGIIQKLRKIYSIDEQNRPVTSHDVRMSLGHR